MRGTIVQRLGLAILVALGQSETMCQHASAAQSADAATVDPLYRLTPEQREQFQAMVDYFASRQAASERPADASVHPLAAAVLANDADALATLISADDFDFSMAQRPDILAAVLVGESPFVIDIGESLDPEGRARWLAGMLRLAGDAEKWTVFAVILGHLFADDGSSSLPCHLHHASTETLVRSATVMPADVYTALPRRGVIARAVSPLGETPHSNLFLNPVMLALVLEDHPAGASVVTEFGAPLHRAAFHSGENAVESVRVLLRYGADPHLRDPGGMTALMYAAVNSGSGTQELLSLLLEAGARVSDQAWDPGPLGEKRWTALHFAASSYSRGAPEVAARKVEAMLRVAHCVDIQDFDGNTAMHIAYRQEATEVIDLLLRHGANPDTRNRDGLTPSEMTPRRGSTHRE